MLKNLKPLVGVLGDVQHLAPHDYHTAGDKYISALLEGSQVAPVIIPTRVDDKTAEHWLSRLDGILLTGAYSMLNPARYNDEKIDMPYLYDDDRDQSSFGLIRKAIELNLPVLAICRGIQDVNVALGGSLYQAIEQEDGFNDHREDKSLDLDGQYGPAHSVALTPNGKLADIYKADAIIVNSLHSQGIKTVGAGLSVEAVSDDGVVESVSIDAMTFGIAVQWHPEWNVMNNPTQKLLFEAFGDACRAQQSKNI